MKLEKIMEGVYFKEWYDKKFKICATEQDHSESEAALTLYLHNHSNGNAEIYRNGAIQYLKKNVILNHQDEPISEKVAE